MTDFSELLHEAEKLTTNIEGSVELPKVERSLRQVLEASNDLYARVAQTGAKDIQANLLLGSKGVDLPKIVQKLEAISTKRTFEPVEPVDERDITSCLENQIRNCILSVIDEENKKCSEDVYRESWESRCGDWKQEKRKIISAMVAPSGSILEFPKLLLTVRGGDSQMSTSSGLTYQESIYSSKVAEYNKAIIRSTQKPNLVTMFAKAAEEFKDTKVNEMWEIMKYMVELPPFPSSEEIMEYRYKKHIIEAFAKQGCKYLEHRYRTYMNNIINENLMSAMRGGIPGTYTLVRSFVSVRFQGEFVGLEDGCIDDRPLWPMVYYCLRSGDISAALHCLKMTNNSDRQELVNILEMKFNNPDDPNIRNIETNIRFNYRRHIRNSTDPFKRIVWSVLGCVDVADEHSEVATTADDYLWLKLSLVRTDYGKEECVTYVDLQRTIFEEYGESHYDAEHQPHLYFQMLALTGQFEAALEFLTRTERYKVHSVHMAIALNELYIIATPRDVAAPLIYVDPEDHKPSRRMNLTRLIMIYVRKFEIICPAEAIHYFFLLRNLHTLEGENLFVMCVSDLILESKEWEKILGKLQPNGMRTKGLIDEFAGSTVNAESIALATAEKLTKKGLFEDAIELYDLANNQEEVLSLFCTLLSQVVFLQHQPGSLRERLQIKTNEISERYCRQGYNCSAGIVQSFNTLKEFLVFFNYYHSKQYTLAVKILNELKVIPLNQDELDERVNQFKRLNVDVCKVIPDVLLATMNMLFSAYQNIKSQEFIPSKQDMNIEKQVAHVRMQAKVLTSFAGMLPYRMPSDTNSRLVQMEILMH